MSRKVADCRKSPSVMGCTLTISGEEDEVARAAIDHAVSVHGHERTPELELQIRQFLEDEETDTAPSAPRAEAEAPAAH